MPLNSPQFLTITALDRIGTVLHAFTTRQNGLGSRNSGIKSPDDWKVVAEEFGVSPDRLVVVNQVHEENIVTVDQINFAGLRAVRADAMITKARGLALGVETADCVPILLVDPVTPAIGAVHAGWRSTVGKIVRKAVKQMSEEFGSDPSRILAGIGPAIGPECYEVDEPVMARVREAFPFWKDVSTPSGSGRWNLDLAKANTRELIEAGLEQNNIHSLGMCTCCRRDLFYSFRAEGRTGRMLSAVMIRP